MGVLILPIFFLIVWCLVAALSLPCILISSVITHLMNGVRLSWRLVCGALLAGVYVLFYFACMDNAVWGEERRLWLAVWFIFTAFAVNLPIFASKELGRRRTAIIICVALAISCFFLLESRPFPV